jgi:hypothetical protein
MTWFISDFDDPRPVTKRLLHYAGRIGGIAAEPSSPTAGEMKRTPRLHGRSALAVALLPVRLVAAVWRVARLRWTITKSLADEPTRVRLHTNASGDFTLMSRADWLKTGGYAEYEMYSMHIDGLQLYIAHYSGIEERFLPFPIFHVEHGGGFRPEAKGDDSLDAVLQRRTIPQITNAQLMEYIIAMHREQAPLQPNSSDWGFASTTLLETSPQDGKSPVETAVTEGNS